MKRKESLRVKMALLVIFILVLVVIFGMVISNIFLNNFYMSSKRDSLVRAFNSINAIYLEGLENSDGSSYSSGTSGSISAETSESGKEESAQAGPGSNIPLPDDGDTGTAGTGSSDNSSSQTSVSEGLQLEIDKISNNRSLSILIYRSVYYTHDLFGLSVVQKTNRLLYSSLGIGQDSQLSNDKIYSDYTYSRDDGEETLQAGSYRIREVNVERLGSGYLYLEGRLPNNDCILMRASVASIRESVHLSNTFFFWILFFAGIFGFIVTYFSTKTFTKPITELTAMAKRMSELDFTAKYKVTTNDEIGDLGHSINTLSETLEKAIAELKDANTELKKDLKKKEEVDELRKEFLSNVSHELKTPIALIQGYAEGLLDNITDDEESREFYCEVIVDEAKKMNNMVKQIMSLNQLEFGYSHANIEYFDITGLIKSVITRSDILIKEKGAKVEFDDSVERYVWSDSFMIDEVFTNYFTNALNHLDGEKIICVTAQKRDKVLRVGVFNTGDNIPEESIDRIWDKFYKVDKARTREYGGSGVGLSIVKATMNLLGQDFGVENKEDGVLFWFEVDCSSGKPVSDTDGEES